jgi:hypothetical protein
MRRIRYTERERPYFEPAEGCCHVLAAEGRGEPHGRNGSGMRPDSKPCEDWKAEGGGAPKVGGVTDEPNKLPCFNEVEDCFPKLASGSVDPNGEFALTGVPHSRRSDKGIPALAPSGRKMEAGPAS